MRNVSAIILTAMPEEAEPFLQAAKAKGTEPQSISSFGTSSAWLLPLTTPPIALIRTGIGQSATASALGWALSAFQAPVVFSAGSAGGLGVDVNVGEVVVGKEYRYGTADATAFDYEPGQIPGQPPAFTAPPEIAETIKGRHGLMLSGDSFITAANVGEMRERFPDALTADMESTAAAQVCHAAGVPFVSVRGISDLCGPRADQEFHMALDVVAGRSATAVLAAIASRHTPAAPHPSQKFSRDSLEAALWFVLGFAYLGDAFDDADHAGLTPTIARALELPSDDPLTQKVAKMTAAGQSLAAQYPETTLSAARYDATRRTILREFGLETGRGSLVWPPTSQTVTKRFDGRWNSAIEAIGLQGQMGRTPGGTKFSEQDYLTYLRAYLKHTEDSGRAVSFNSYVAWVKDVEPSAPSGASLRQKFGTWLAALDAARAAG